MSPQPEAARLAAHPSCLGDTAVLGCPMGRSLTCHLSLARANPMLNLSLDPSHDLGFHEDSSSVAR